MRRDRNGPIRALVVEDDFLVAAMVQGMLRQIGCEVVGWATGGEEAVSLALAHMPDVVVMDIQLNDEVSGIEAARRISERWPMPVVILSAYESPELLQEATRAGVGAYLLKPPDERDLERAITIARARFQDLVEIRRLTGEVFRLAHELEAAQRERDNLGELLLRTQARLGAMEVDDQAEG